MKLSKAFWQTQKEDPSDAEIASHKLLMRAGLIHKTAAGIYSYLPFAVRTLRKIENIVREELNKIYSQEITMSIVTPGDLWKETNRWETAGAEMLKLKDKGNRDLCISPTNEETITDIFRKHCTSYKQLPVSLYQINTKFRDEIRPRFGLMRGREFTMKDAYSFHLDQECLEKGYKEFYQAYSNIFKRMGLDFIIVEADGGIMAGKDDLNHEFQVIASAGEDAVVVCEELNYAANVEKAKTIRKIEFNNSTDASEVIDTPDKSTIKDVAEFLSMPEHHTLKSMVYTGIKDDKETHYLVMLLGDDEVNDVKLANFFSDYDHFVPAKDHTLDSLGLYKGYIGPVGELKNLKVIFEEAVELEKAFVVGANQAGKHVKNFIPKRDYQGEVLTADFRTAKEGDFMPGASKPVTFKRGIEVGHIFQLGQKYTSSMEAQVLDQNGKTNAPLMGCYGIGITRTMQAAIEQNHDKDGIKWPLPIAPFEIYFVAIAKSDETKELAETVYQDMQAQGFEVLYDDRKGGPGSKFKDADLLGVPIRVVLGERDYNESGELEIKVRGSEAIKVKKDDLNSKLKELVSELTPKV